MTCKLAIQIKLLTMASLHEKDDFELLKKLLNDDFSFTKNQRNKVLDILMSYIEVQTGCKLDL